MIRIFNSMTRAKEDLQPLEPGRIGMYLCGDTVLTCATWDMHVPRSPLM